METEENVIMLSNSGISSRKCDDLNGWYHKQDFLNFELHRRSFQRCMIQLYSVAKVKCWLPHVNIYRRCKCCNPEYYEFAADLLRIKDGTLKRSKPISNLMDIEAFTGGRTLGCTRTNFVRAIPSTCSYNTGAINPEITHSNRNLDAADNGLSHSTSTLSPLNTLTSSSSSDSSSSSSSGSWSYIYLNTEDNWVHMSSPWLSMLSMTPSNSYTRLEEEEHSSPTLPPRDEEVIVAVTNASGFSSHSKSHLENGKNAAPVVLRTKKKVSFDVSTASDSSPRSDINLEHGDSTAHISFSKSQEIVSFDLSNPSSSSDDNKSALELLHSRMELKSILKKSSEDKLETVLPKKRYVTFNLSDDVSHPIQYSDETGPVFAANTVPIENKSESKKLNLIWSFAKRLFK